MDVSGLYSLPGLVDISSVTCSDVFVSMLVPEVSL